MVLRKARLEDDPLWYRDAVIYEVHVKSFYDSSGDGIGDFRGLLQKLPYLEDLGITDGLRKGWDVVRLAEHYGIARSTMYDRLKAAGISLREMRKSGNRNSSGRPENHGELNS